METRIQILLIVVTIVLLGLVLELVRRRRLLERYALLWVGAAAVLVVLAVWRGLLETLATAVGIYYAPSALFVTAFGFVLILLLHFSLVVSRLTDQNKLLAQHIGLLREELDRLKAQAPQDAAGDGVHEATLTGIGASQAERLSPAGPAATRESRS